MYEYNMTYPNELYHYGIKGMKWGVRRYQNEDGSLTSAGKKRYADASSLDDAELTSQVKRLNLEKQYKKLTKEDEPKSKLDLTKKAVDASSELVRQAKNIERDSRPKSVKQKLDLSSMSDQQLRDRINRANLEKQYNDLFGPKETVTISKGRKFAQNALEIGGSALVVTSSVLGIAASIKQILD